MAKAIWAVACLFFVFLFLSIANASAESDPGDGGPPIPAPPKSLSVVAPVPPAKIVAARGKDNVAPVVALDTTYKMGPEDVLRVSVWENKDLTLDLVVRPDGRISMPLIQDVQAEGLTAAELAVILRQRLETFIKDPQVSVILLQVNAPKIFVIGNVAKPGPYPLRSETNVLQALSQAGGFTQFASPRSIKLVRGSGLKQVVRKINYYNVIDEGGEGNFLLSPGDTIVVP